jgi:hypothetical protein
VNMLCEKEGNGARDDPAAYHAKAASVGKNWSCYRRADAIKLQTAQLESKVLTGKTR